MSAIDNLPTMALDLPSPEFFLVNSSTGQLLPSVKTGNIFLKEEIEKSWKSALIDLSEGAVIYAGRILEEVTREVCKVIGFKKEYDNNTAKNLNKLRESGHISSKVYFAADLLRRFGNEVRHVQVPLGANDHWIALSALRIFVEWYLKEFEKGPNIKDIEKKLPKTKFDNELGLILPEGNLNKNSLEHFVRSKKMPPLLRIILMERGIDLEEYGQVFLLINSFKKLHKGQHRFRLRQLEALALSRSGQYEKAIKLFSSHPRKFWDHETSGIVAGAHKRKWLKSGSKEHLNSAYENYLESWKKNQNIYTGINAASCARWLKNKDIAIDLAREVLNFIDTNHKYIPSCSKECWDFYSLATKAEALLIIGEEGESELLETKALKQGSKEGRPVQIFIDQMTIHRKVGY
jgi:tetratricopeptide (TPR) repeat protein